MNKRKVTKMVVGAVVGFGAGFIVTAIIKKNVVPVKLIHKIGVGVATLAISGMIADEAVEYTNELIDSTFDMVDDIKTGSKEFLAMVNTLPDEGEKSPGEEEVVEITPEA